MKGRAAMKRAVACEAGAWASVPVQLMPIPHWLYSALDWGSGAVALLSFAAMIVIVMWNFFGPGEEPEPAAAPEARVPRACERPAAAPLARTVTGHPGTGMLRYSGPPRLYTPPHGNRAVYENGAIWVQGSPLLSSGRCGKCGESMPAHLYYGQGQCITVLLCPGCGQPAAGHAVVAGVRRCAEPLS